MGIIMEFMVDLNRVEDVKEFVRFAEIYDADIIVSSPDRKFSVDGTSIMGVFSLDFREPLLVHISNREAGKGFKKAVEKFVM